MLVYLEYLVEKNTGVFVACQPINL